MNTLLKSLLSIIVIAGAIPALAAEDDPCATQLTQIETQRAELQKLETSAVKIDLTDQNNHQVKEYKKANCEEIANNSSLKEKTHYRVINQCSMMTQLLLGEAGKVREKKVHSLKILITELNNRHSACILHTRGAFPSTNEPMDREVEM